MKTVITRKSRLGWGYTTACEQKWNHDYTESYLAVCEPTKPDHTGTIRQVIEAILNDRSFQAEKGNTCYRSAWFVKIGKKYHRIIDFSNLQSPYDLLEDDGDGRYMINAIEAEID